MLSKIVILLMVLLSFLFSDDYRTIQRNTNITTNNGENHKVGDFGNYYALLIYVEKYKYLGNLTTPKKDVEAIAKILKNRYGFVEPKIVPNPKNRDDLVDILDGFKNRLNKNDNLLIYYAGHGSEGGYWQLSDAKKNTRSGWILIKEAINETLKEIRSRHILVIADSCYSGVLTRAGVDKNMLDPEDREYFSKLYKIKSRNVLTSGGFKPVLDKDPTNPNHSIFANGLLNMLRDNNQLIFSLEEKYKEVEAYVEKNSNDEQTPLYSHVKGTGYEEGGDFIFLDKKSIADKMENEKNKLYSLTIERTPSDATVQVLQIKQIYKDGMMLKRGQYEIFVFAEGYKEKRFFVVLEDTLNYSVELESEKSALVYEGTKAEVVQKNNSEDSFIELFWERTSWTNLVIGVIMIVYSLGLIILTVLTKAEEKIHYTFNGCMTLFIGLMVLFWEVKKTYLVDYLGLAFIISFILAIVTQKKDS